MGGGGFLYEMNKAIERNRAMLKRRSLEDGSSKTRLGGTLGKDWKYKKASKSLLQNIRSKAAIQRRRNFFKAAFIMLTVVALFAFGSWKLFNLKVTPPKPIPLAESPIKVHTTKIYKTGKWSELRVEYIDKGTKLCETNYRAGKKHQNTESYYASGEQFRSAAYFYDTLVVDYYFFKNGDTIKNFPDVLDGEVHHLAFRTSDQSTTVSFDFWDGKVVPGTYQEYDIKKGVIK